jgi:Methyltransferase FkbM domain
MGNTLNRSLRHLLARAPNIYLAALRAFGRGSPEKRMYLSIVRCGDIVFDIGANAGYFTELFSDLVGPNGEVHAFEPLPSTFEHLSRSLARFPRYENVFLNCVALGDAESLVTLFIPNEDHAQADQNSSWRWKNFGPVPLAGGQKLLLIFCANWGTNFFTDWAPGVSNLKRNSLPVADGCALGRN